MDHANFKAFLQAGVPKLGKGPIGLLFLEDEVAVTRTVAHHLGLGFGDVVVFAEDGVEIAPDLKARVHFVRASLLADDAHATIINALIPRLQGRWLYYGFNAEFLFFPFCETRTIRDMTTFMSEERRDSVLTYVVDLYAADLDTHPDGVDLEGAHLDRSGYYASPRLDADGHPKERQLNFHGGIRWRHEELIPEDKRRIDRIAIFRAQKGLALNPDHTFNIEEYNTYSCPWHHNLTAAILSFRTVKALKRNPGTRDRLTNLTWHNSVPFEWSSQQLMDLGLMEPGQWF